MGPEARRPWSRGEFASGCWDQRVMLGTHFGPHGDGDKDVSHLSGCRQPPMPSPLVLTTAPPGHGVMGVVTGFLRKQTLAPAGELPRVTAPCGGPRPPGLHPPFPGEVRTAEAKYRQLPAPRVRSGGAGTSGGVQEGLPGTGARMLGRDRCLKAQPAVCLLYTQHRKHPGRNKHSLSPSRGAAA